MQDVVIFIWMILILIGLLFCYRFYLFLRSLHFEKRLSPYTVDFKEETFSLLDRIQRIYGASLSYVTKFLKKTRLFSRYSKKYDVEFQDGVKIVGTKLMTGVFVAIIVLLLALLGNLPFAFSLGLIGLVFGFYSYDIFHYFYLKRRNSQMVEDLIQVLTIMNHSFQAGNSIMQAISTVSKEVQGPLQKEFQKMYMDLTFGLDLETTLKRFYQRVPLEDIHYLTSSLIIFNQTGGNIVTIFKLMEKNFYTRKELKKELKATTASAKLIFQILIIMPIFLIGIITLLSPSYFKVLVTTGIGIFISMILLILYIFYIWLIRHIMKIEY